MVGYAELAKLSTFSMADVEALTANRHTAHSMVRRLMRNGLVQKIRSNLYSCVSVETGQDDPLPKDKLSQDELSEGGASWR